jgi:hypothetical protein
MKVEDLSAIREGAKIQSMKPYMDNEISGLQKAVISFVLAAVNNGTLTPEMALSKWVEYVSYVKLQQKLEQRIRIGQDIGAKNAQDLDFTAQTGYTAI